MLLQLVLILTELGTSGVQAALVPRQSVAVSPSGSADMSGASTATTPSATFASSSFSPFSAASIVPPVLPSAMSSVVSAFSAASVVPPAVMPSSMSSMLGMSSSAMGQPSSSILVPSSVTPMSSQNMGSMTASSAAVQTTMVGTGTTDLGWVQTTGLPTITSELPSTNAEVIMPTATGPVGRMNISGYSSQDLETLWNQWVGPVEEPPLDTVPTPPNPYPLPNSPPPLYPDFYTTQPKDMLPGYKFPKDFLFGYATAAQQWEGAVKADGKGPSIWDWASRFPGFIADNTTSDVGDLGYYLYKEDLARIAALGANVYSFSIFWTRVYPFGFADSPLNQAGLDFYKNLTDYAWSLGIEPVATLFHWDTPLAIQIEYGGFASDKIIDDYVNYAETVFRALNGTVHKWITFNEPVVFCSQMASPVNSTLPSNLNSTVYPYTCSYHLTLAHAKTVQRFRELNIQGQISFKSDNFVGVPWRNDSQEDMEAMERHQAYQIGIFAEPIYNTGDWPDLIKNDLPPEILPRFTQDEINMIKCTADFFPIDGYRDGYVQAVDGGVEACVANISNPLWPVCNQVNFYDSTPAGWAIGTFGNWPTTPWLQNTWQFVRPFLADLAKRYPSPGGYYLSEFGFSEPFENEKNYIYQITQDAARTAYFNSYMGEVLKGIVDDGLDIRGMFAWSMVDNFEWNSGLSTRFGVQYVDYDSPTRQRTFKRSALEMSEFWNAHRCYD